MKKTRTLLIIRYLSCMPLMILLFIPAYIMNIFSTKTSFTERAHENQDNAYYLFLDRGGVFLSKKVKGVKQTYAYNNLLAQVWFFLRSKNIYTSHIEYSSPVHPKIWKKIPIINKKKIIYVKHGMILANMGKWQQKDHSVIDTYTAFGPTEYKLSKEMGYADKDIEIMHMPRISKYGNTFPNKTLIMLTWDKTLVEKSKSEFISSEYFKKIVKLCIDNKNSILRLHPQMQKFSSCFNGFNISEDTIEYLMMNTNKIITDRSSIFVDYIATNREVQIIDSEESKYGSWDNEVINNIGNPGQLKKVLFWDKNKKFK